MGKNQLHEAVPGLHMRAMPCNPLPQTHILDTQNNKVFKICKKKKGLCRGPAEELHSTPRQEHVFLEYHHPWSRAGRGQVLAFDLTTYLCWVDTVFVPLKQQSHGAMDTRSPNGLTLQHPLLSSQANHQPPLTLKYTSDPPPFCSTPSKVIHLCFLRLLQ